VDVVRLAIVYDTNQAAGRLNDLNRRLNDTNGHSRKAANAAVSLAQAFSNGNVSATSLTHSLSGLGGRLGDVGIGLATAAGLLLTFRNITDKARDMAHKFEDQLRNTRRAVDELLAGDIRSPLQTQVENITDAIRELDRTLAVQRMGILERLGIHPTFRRGRNDEISKAILRFFGGGVDERVLQQRGALAGELDRLTPRNLAGSMASRATADLGRISSVSGLTRGSRADMLAEQVKRLEKELSGLLEILPDDSIEVQNTARVLNELADSARRAARAETLVKNGLETTAAALEDFVVTGTVAFTDFLNNILRLLYRDFTGELIHGVMRSAFGGSGPQGVGANAGDTLEYNSAPPPSAQSNVTINVTTMDAQGVATFVRQHGPTIAAEVTRQAGRASAMRRTFRRG
jgi:HPt (histidine-containing phosphotransfer) domain-containing protein